MKFTSKYLNEIHKFGTKHWRTILVAGASVSICVAANNYYQNKISKPYSLYNYLDYYGFTTNQQKVALEELMRHASILNVNQSFQDRFPKRRNANELAGDIIEFVTLTQKYFTIRNNNQERWQVKLPKWMEENKEENIKLIKTLGFIDSISPTNDEPDAICILGATLPTMQNRINYASLLIDQGLKTKNLILLSGERYITIDVDGTKEELAKIAKEYDIEDPTKLTETDLIKQAYKYSDLKDKLPTHIIDTPASGMSRPTTQTTIIELIEWLKLHNGIKNIVFVSNQPYVKYQQAIIIEVLQSKNCSLDVEVVGAGKTDIENVQPLIESIGTYIWAQTPAVLRNLKGVINDPKFKEDFKQLYASQPLIYINFQNLGPTSQR